MTIELTFCGAAQTVTGSCFWIRTAKTQFLVDCGMFQGPKSLKALNYGAFPFDPAALDFVLLTHAHTDHAGLIPRLIRMGFDGPVYATRGTRDLLSYMLPDSGHIQEMEVTFLNRRRARRGLPEVAAIYTREQGDAAINCFRPVPYETWLEPAAGVRVRFWNAGHILGSASIELEMATERPPDRQLRLLFSGDIGPEHKLFHPDPKAPENWDYVICEATYGGRGRADLSAGERRNRLGDIVRNALGRNGVLVIPAFAIERTQELLADLAILLSERGIPQVSVFLDSPLAIRATGIFDDHADGFEDVGMTASAFRHPSFHFTESVAQSRAIERYTSGVIIIAASGMCDAGRIRHHLKNHLWRDNATILLTGYQAPGTLGRFLQDGARTVRIQGEDIRVKADIRSIDFYSGHADGDSLVRWIQGRQPIKRGLFLVHGEENGLNALKTAIAEGGFPEDRIVLPRLDDSFQLLGEAVRPELKKAPRRLAPDVVGRPDWHNHLTRLSITLRDMLEDAPDEKTRTRILKRLDRAVEDAWAHMPPSEKH